MFTKKVSRTRSNNIDNTTTGVGLNIAGLANSTYHDPQLMFQRKRAINLNHLYSYQTEGGSVPSVSGLVRSAERSLVLDHFGFDHPSQSRVLGDLERTSLNREPTDSYHSASTTGFDQSMFGLRLAERSIGSTQSHFYRSDPSKSHFAGKSSKLMDSSISAVRLAERSIDSTQSHFYHSNPSASQSVRFAGKSTNSKLLDSSMFSVRSAERSIDSNVLHSYHSDPSAYQLQSLASASRSMYSKPLNSYSSTRVTSFDPSISDVRSAERSIVLNQLHSFRFEPSAYQLHTAGLTESSIYSKVLNSDYPAAQIGTFDLSTSDVRSAERSLVL